MHKVSLAIAVLGSAFSALAQTNCSGAPAAQTFSNRAEFEASFYYNIGMHIFDLNVQTPITITGLKTWLYDSGVGQPPVPNQVGNTAVVDVFTCPGTRLGNETLGPGGPWTQLGSGTLTVVDTAVGNGESPVVFAPGLVLAPGSYGVAVIYRAPTAGLNPGPLHCLGKSPNPAITYTDDAHFLTMSNDGIVATAWAGAGTASPNLRINYTPAANSAQHLSFGDGCYFAPQAFYESFASPGTPDLANTSFTMLNLGTSYLVIPGGVPFVPSTSPNLTASAPGSSLPAGNWDDALTTPITLPFTFNYPGGSTNEITIASNGHVFLANVVNSGYGVVGASYGSIVPFRDDAARIAPLYVDLDPSPTGGGSIHYDVDPSNSFVRITWAAIPEWTPAGPGPLNTMQVTLYSSGNADVVYGAIGMTSTAGNNAVAGFTPGFGSRLGPAIDISASLPYQAGDGRIPPVMTMDARAVLGTTPNVITRNITAGTVFQIFIAGLTSTAPTPLSPFGMSGCFQHINPFTAFLTSIGGGGEFSVAFAIPNHPSYQGMQMFFQSAPLTPGLNQAGIITSNGLCAKLSSL
jgi:hypothetical protein